MNKEYGISEKHNLVYANAPRMWTDGLLLGNGDIGAVFYAPYHLTWIINKTDVYDYRMDAPPNLTHEDILAGVKAGKTVREIRKAKGASPTVKFKPGPKSCAELQICFDKVSAASNWSPPHKISSVINLRSANLEISADKHQSHPRINSFIHAERNVMVIRIRGNSHITPPAIVELRSIEEPDMPAVQWTVKGDTVFMQREIPGSMTVVTALKAVPAGWGGYANTMKANFREKYWSLPSANPEPKTDGGKARFSLNGDFDIFLSVVTSEECADPFGRALEIVQQSSEEGFEKCFEQHRNWWTDFWSRSSVRLDEEMLESLWYFSLYALASQYRQAPVPALLGLGYGLPEEPGGRLPWAGVYTNDQNSQMPAMPCWSVNHPELGEAYCETFIRMMESAKKAARTLFGMDGAYYPSACDTKGREMMTDEYLYIFSGPYLGVPFVWAWKYTRDRNILKKYSYPYCREQAIFFSQYCTFDEKNGRYRLWPCMPPELSLLDSGNATHTLSCLKLVLKHAIEGSEILSVDGDRREKWEHLLAHFPAYPEADGILLESDAYDENHYISQAGGLYPVFPCGEYGAESAKEILDKCIKTYRTSFLRHSLQLLSQKDGAAPRAGWMWFFWNMDALRLGLKEEAWEMLHECGLRLFLKPNGLFTHNAVICAEPSESEANYNSYPGRILGDYGDQMPVKEPWSGHDAFSSPVMDGKEYVFPVLENTSAYLMVITEMLVQGYEGIIRLFPGWPEDKSASFKDLRVEGAFLVSATKNNRDILCCRIKSLAGGAIRLKTPWENAYLSLNGNNNFMSQEQTDGYINLTMSPGDEALISPVPAVAAEPSFNNTALPGAQKVVFKDGSRAWYGKPEWDIYYKR